MSTDQKIDECRAEVDTALDELHRRLESVESIQQIIRDIYAATKHTDERLANLMVSFSSYAAKQDEINSGFPDGDPHGHRKAHELFIRQAEAKAAFWQKMRDEAMKWGIIGALGFVFTAVWVAVKAELHK